jgi:hypothetical protein
MLRSSRVAKVVADGSDRARPARAKLASAETVVPPGDGSIDSFVTTPRHLFVTYQVGGPSELRVFALDGTSTGKVSTVPVSAIGSVVQLEGDAVLFGNGSFCSR